MVQCLQSFYYTLPHDSGKVLSFHDGCPSVIRLSVFLFPDDNLSKYHLIVENIKIDSKRNDL